MLAAVAAMTLFVFVVMSAGFLLLRAANAADMPAPAAWALGVFATAMAVYGISMAFQVLAATAFVAWAILVVGLRIVFPDRALAGRVDWTELLGLALCAAVTVMWCREVAAAPAILAREGYFPAWIDHFIHAGVISQFGDPLAAGRQSIHLADLPMPLYHYASYFLPAVFAAPLDLPGLPLSASLWLPMGFFTMCAGGYALGAALARPAGGIAAIAALTLLPDASNYGLRNGFLSFHWNIITLPGALYAIGMFLVAMALVQRWSSTGQWRPLAAAVCLAGGLLPVRVHLFALGFPALLAAAAASTRWVQRHLAVSLGVAALAFTLFVLMFYELTGGVPALEFFIVNVHTLHEPTAYGDWYRALLESHGSALTVPLGMLGVFVASLGAWTVAYPVALALVMRSRPLGAADRAPIAVIACYILLMLTAPISQHGDSTELTQRPFVLLYAVIAAWSSAALVEWMVLQARLGERRTWTALLAASAIALPFLWPHTAELGGPKFVWGKQHVSHEVAHGLPNAAEFLRRNFRPGEVFAVQGGDLWSFSMDAATEVTSLAGTPAYLARPSLHMTKDRRRQQVALERYWALVRVADERDISAAMARLRDLGIRWYVVADGAGPRWDPERRRAAFAAGEVAVYSSGSNSR